MAITLEYSAGVNSNTGSFNIGAVGNDRLVVVMTDDENSGSQAITAVTVDGKSCTEVPASACINTSGAGNHSTMWYIGETALGSSNGTVTVSITGGDTGHGLHVHTYYGVNDGAPEDSSCDNTPVSVSTVVITGMDCPADGIVVFTAGNGGSQTFVSATSPLSADVQVNPTSAIQVSGHGIETSEQTNKSYTITFSAAFNRGSGIAASWAEAVTGVTVTPSVANLTLTAPPWKEPSTAGDQVMEIRVRKATGSPLYKPVDVTALLTSLGFTISVEQVSDE